MQQAAFGKKSTLQLTQCHVALFGAEAGPPQQHVGQEINRISLGARFSLCVSVGRSVRLSVCSAGRLSGCVFACNLPGH